MSVARSFLLLSAGVVAGGLSMMTLEGEIDWLRWVRGARLTSPLPPPVVAEAPSLPPPPAPVVASAGEKAPAVVPETVIVNLGQQTASIPVGLPALRGAGRQVPIAQELQSELQRVGCYGGAVDGYWSPLAQRSAKAFVEGVNAQLPVGEPDVALLALVRATRSTVCAKPCPPDARPGADSVCKPVKASPDSTAISLTRQVPTTEAPGAPAQAASAQPAPIPPASAQGASAQPGAAPDPVTAALTPLPATPQPPRQKAAAQQKPTATTFGVEIFGRLNQSRY